MALETGEDFPWAFWRVRFAERGICKWQDFDDMTLADVAQVLAVWDGMGRASAPAQGPQE